MVVVVVVAMSAFGWLPDTPDARDYTRDTVMPFLRLTRAVGTDPLPVIVDLREGCSPVEQQGRIGSCSAHAAAGVVEFMQRRVHAKYVDMSRRFVYKMTRQRSGLSGDSGAALRETMKTLVDAGAPPEALWPYDVDRFDDEPPAEVYAAAERWQALTYYTLDPPGLSLDRVLDDLRRSIAAGIPAMFGFAVYGNWDRRSAVVPMPSSRDQQVGGHAVVCVGYDDTQDLLLFRNSWGTAFGDAGYGWLPYAYLLRGLVQDIWCVLTQEWVETGAFA